MSYPYAQEYKEYKNVMIAILSNKKTIDYLEKTLLNKTIIPVDVLITLYQMSPPAVDQVDYVLDYLSDMYVFDPSVGIDPIDENYIDVITMGSEINNNEIKNQIEHEIHLLDYDTPEFLKMVYPHHSVLKIMY